jgi:hypothetical protein
VDVASPPSRSTVLEVGMMRCKRAQWQGYLRLARGEARNAEAAHVQAARHAGVLWRRLRRWKGECPADRTSELLNGAAVRHIGCLSGRVSACLHCGCRADASVPWAWALYAHAVPRGGRPPSRAAAAVSSRDMRSFESVSSCICRLIGRTQRHACPHIHDVQHQFCGITVHDWSISCCAHLAGPCRVHGEVQIAVEPAENISFCSSNFTRVHMQEAAPI